MKFYSAAAFILAINAGISITISMIDSDRQFFVEGMLMGLAAMHLSDWGKK
jgi:hypothetical protein